VRIAYLPAYYRDCGWSGASCMLRMGRCGAHDGDSEFIVLDVDLDPNSRRWLTAGVFLSAHCFGRSTGRCRWYRGSALQAFTWADGVPTGAPRIWVARGKHAQYPSQGACERGHWFQDSCDPNGPTMRFPVLSDAQNIGSRNRPLPTDAGCIASEALPLDRDGASPGMRECLWDPSQSFWSWQATRTGIAPTPYEHYLRHVAEF